MPKFYFTFGQNHSHVVNGEFFDKDCVAEVEADTHAEARQIAFDAFGPKFCTSYDESVLADIIKFYPRGVIRL